MGGAVSPALVPTEAPGRSAMLSVAPASTATGGKNGPNVGVAVLAGPGADTAGLDPPTVVGVPSRVWSGATAPAKRVAAAPGVLA